ncbi:uncharacterized protein LOC122274504 [Carya illinoinensis]|uniref:uncharacterized protein LOC122274504 n=1 Tax=Carya illinoinensis TaxID=32201 RepID=UPI001C725973|nr:uncharacterized protein LOC122274504 [Carya illinoinensis]
MENLKRRRLDVKDKCIFCKDNVEDMQHALLHCPSIQAHWSKYLPMGFWFRRNKMMHEKVCMDPAQVTDFVFSMKKVPHNRRQIPTPKQQPSHQWLPPPVGSCKLNVDGAKFNDQKKAGVRIILRDFSGDVVLATSKREEEVADPSTVEILAMFRGLQICANMGIQNLILENDCLMMISKLQTNSDSFVHQRVLVQETRRLMQLFQNCSAQHVNHLGNEVAHRLVKHAWNVEESW